MINEKQAARMKNLRISHKKNAEFGITLDLATLVNRALTEVDQCKANAEGLVKSYNLASTGGFISLQAPGFEDVQISVNVITSKSKYDAMVIAENAAKAVVPTASVPATTVPTDSNALMQAMMVQMQEMQAKIIELSAPKTRKKSTPVT